MLYHAYRAESVYRQCEAISLGATGTLPGFLARGGGGGGGGALPQNDKVNRSNARHGPRAR